MTRCCKLCKITRVVLRSPGAIYFGTTYLRVIKFMYMGIVLDDALQVNFLIKDEPRSWGAGRT